MRTNELKELKKVETINNKPQENALFTTLKDSNSYSVFEIINHYNKDTQTRKANKSANQVVINVANYLLSELNNANAKNVIIKDVSSNGLMNRGVVVECLIKTLFNHRTNACKSANGADFISKGVKYEVKCSTSKGYAHYDPKQKLDNLVFINQYGIYLIKDGANAIILDKCGKHIQTIKHTKDTTTIKEWDD